MKDAVTTIAVPRDVRVYGHASPERPSVSREAVAALAAQIESDSWSAMLARHPHLTKRLATVKARRA